MNYVANIRDLWERQSKQQLNWYDIETLSSEDKASILDKLLLSLQEEVGDLQKLVDRQKYHVLRRIPPNVNDVSEAGVDIFKMLVSILQLHGVSVRDFVETFSAKSDVVDDKWKREQSQLRQDEEILAVDLDGCIADWIKGFLLFCASRGVVITAEQVNDIMLEPLKDEYHSSGGFLTLGLIDGAKEELELIRAHDVRIVVVTARPYHQFKRIYSDTMVWCREKSIVYDHIIFKKDKAEAIASLAPARVLGHVEDRAKHALEVALTGTTVFKLPSYGGEKVEHPKIIPVSGWAAIREAVLASRRNAGGHLSGCQRDVTFGIWDCVKHCPRKGK